ncbi:hypothetical protein OEZ85_010484 [Tetradesmus obliquus]|uniref:Uncharacterized protein n=1 Tax=Tetradesmus obliquus TaxID=3088 RepID=A0ABY8TMR3_TETOB|nr:hypothetical protein OEZ85_010484 [Tetradesmus obliquus]
MNRLDRILELVTDHEANYREQDIKLSEATQKMAELEMRMAQELAPLWALKERNIPQELDLARTAVETVVRQLTAVTKTNQMLQSELKTCQQLQQQQAAQYESAIAVLQADVAALRDRLDDSQQHTRSAVDHLRSSTAQQLEKQAQETEEQLQSVQREHASQLDLLRQDVEAKSTSAVRALEGWAKGELLGLTGKVKAVLAGCAAHQQQVNLQMEALQQQWDNTSSAMDGMAAEDKRLKKHVARLQNQTEELQRMSQQAISSEVALQQMRNDMQQLNTGQQQLATRLEVSCDASSSLRHKDRQLSEFDDLVGRLRRRLQAQQAADSLQGGSSGSSCGGRPQPGTLGGPGSPVRRAMTSAGGGGKYQLPGSPGSSYGGHLLRR